MAPIVARRQPRRRTRGMATIRGTSRHVAGLACPHAICVKQAFTRLCAREAAITGIAYAHLPGLRRDPRAPRGARAGLRWHPRPTTLMLHPCAGEARPPTRFASLKVRIPRGDALPRPPGALLHESLPSPSLTGSW